MQLASEDAQVTMSRGETVHALGLLSPGFSNFRKASVVQESEFIDKDKVRWLHSL